MSDDVSPATLLIWTNSSAAEDGPTLVRLTPDSLTLAAIPGADLEHVIVDLEHGGDVAGQVIPLTSISGAQGDRDSAELTVSFRTGPSKQESREIAFVDRAKRDEFVAALAEVLGPGWHHGQKPVSRWKAGFWTLGPTAVVSLITWGLYAEAALIAQGKPPIDWGRKGKLRHIADMAHWVEQQMGPSGVLIAGAVLVCVGLLLFAIVMASPPMNVVVEHVEQA